MHELEATEYARVSRLFEVLDDHLAVKAALEGTAPATIYVDDPAEPRAAFARIGHRFYLAGWERNEAFNRAVCRLFSDTIYPQGIAAGDEMFVLYYAPAAWEQQIDVVLEGKLPVRLDRHYYVHTGPARHDWRAALPEGFSLQPVDAALVARQDLAGMDALLEEMCSERESVAAFLAHSFGVCPVHAGQIVGWCLSEYNCGDRCEVGIGTHEDYRRRGLATLMAAALIEMAQARGIIQVGWHCWADNVPSTATALKAGFRLVSESGAYLAWFDAAENLAMHGNFCLRAGQYEAAREWFERALAHDGAAGWIHWRAACAAARLGQPDAALRYLSQAVDKGFTHLEPIRDSEHLESLHGTPGWQALLAQLQR